MKLTLTQKFTTEFTDADEAHRRCDKLLQAVADAAEQHDAPVLGMRPNLRSRLEQ